MSQNNKSRVSIVMGSQSDYKTMKLSAKILKSLKIQYEIKIISAHRTPKRMYRFAKNAEKNKKDDDDDNNLSEDIYPLW